MQSNMQILQEILALAKSNLSIGSDMGYTMPDGRHHIHIYPNQEHHLDAAPGESFYVIEPNRVINGAHEPMGDTYLSESRDLTEVLIGCQWCMELFEEDNWLQCKAKTKEEMLPDELTVRLAHEAGWMEAEGKTEVHNWDDLRTAIRDAITEYCEAPQDHTPFCIEDIMEKILIERFPSSPEPTKTAYKEIHILICTQETDYGINAQVSLHPTPKAALAHADAIRQKPDYDEVHWNFTLHSEVIEVNQFDEINPNQLFQLLKQTPDLTENIKKQSLEEQINSASILNSSKRHGSTSKSHIPFHSER